MVLIALTLAASPFMRQPSIHGDQVAFTSEGDIWIGRLSTGEAHRLTSDPGTESYPAFSPDGSQIVYHAEYQGERQAYVINVGGGIPKKLTNVSDFRRPTGWTPDGKEIIFRKAQRPTSYGFYRVPVSGGAPKQFPLEFASNLAMAPTGDAYCFTRFNRWSMAWFRYIGGMQNQIWVSQDGTFKQVSNQEGTNEFPVWVGDRIYFANEQEAKFSLMSVPATGGKARLEFGPGPLEIRELSTDGKSIVFERGQEMNRLDLSTKKVTKVELHLASDLIHAQPTLVAPEAHMSSFGATPTGKRVLVETRGQILSLPFGEGEARLWKAKDGVRYRLPSVSPDSKWVAYLSDESGEQQLCVSAMDGTGEKVLTKDAKRQLNNITWTPDSKAIIFYDSNSWFRHITLETGAERKLAQVELAFFSAPPMDISPDSKWMVYTTAKPVSLIAQVMLCDLTTGKSTPVSIGRYDDLAASFSDDGQYLVVLSRRSIVPNNDPILNQLNLGPTVVPMLLPLRADVKSPFDPKDSNEEVKKEEKKDEKAPDFKIDLEGIWDRRIDLPVPAGGYVQAALVKGKVFLSDGGSLKAFDLASKQLADVPGQGGFDITADKSKLITNTGPVISTYDIASGASKTASYGGLKLRIDPPKEWEQMYWDAWRHLRDFFYLPTMHGNDWDAIGKKYASFVPAIRSRDELDELIRWMQSEIGSGHQYIQPGDMQDIKKRTLTPGLGIDIAPADGYFKITKILRGDGFLTSERSPLIGAGKNVKEGMYLVEVAGVRCTSDADPFSALVGRSGQTVTVKVNSKPSLDGATSYLIKPVGNESRMRYVDWVEQNRKYVDKASGGRVGYIHMAAMGTGDFADFVKQYFGQRDKEALIMDDRFNNGGFVEDFVNRILSHRSSAFWNLRGSRLPWTRQGDYFDGPMACLINEFAISCGEEFPNHFRDLKLGPLIGTRTMGGEIGSDPGWPLADGGEVFVPAYGYFVPGKGWQIEGRGVEPDIHVPSDPNAYAKGRDPQIDKAVEVLMKQLPAKPKPLITQPADRDRVKNPK